MLAEQAALCHVISNEMVDGITLTLKLDLCWPPFHGEMLQVV